MHLQALAALPKDQSWKPRIHMAVPNWQITVIYNSSSKGSDALTQTYMEAENNTNGNKIEKNKNKKNDYITRKWNKTDTEPGSL